ncbi:hypothetical protein BJ875DRAFT_460876 [Amylocarpus encephaloides]|uniref:Uncharacterized protein n=1 Tax=Amylocarpus encephaloides TaxID=45428 RepID=A0A9P8C5Z5_9HELO|nr:hypothetical protein BJ875DRAFT_460876 [Amylocarpus encephaloides]
MILIIIDIVIHHISQGPKNHKTPGTSHYATCWTFLQKLPRRVGPLVAVAAFESGLKAAVRVSLIEPGAFRLYFCFYFLASLLSPFILFRGVVQIFSFVMTPRGLLSTVRFLDPVCVFLGHIILNLRN